MSDGGAKRQMVVCCDGTNSNLTGRIQDTNVVKLVQLISPDSDCHQIPFYDPGVGNPGELPGTTVVDNLKRKFERIAGLAFGRGVYENIADCYLFLMRNHQDGDNICSIWFALATENL